MSLQGFRMYLIFSVTTGDINCTVLLTLGVDVDRFESLRISTLPFKKFVKNCTIGYIKPEYTFIRVEKHMDVFDEGLKFYNNFTDSTLELYVIFSWKCAVLILCTHGYVI